MGKMLRRLRTWFFTGLALMTPLVLTIYFLSLGFRWVDDLLGGVATRLVGRRIPGLGLLASISLAVAVGAIGSNFIGRELLGWGETLVLKIPLVKNVYGTIRQVVEAFTGQNKSAFREVVMVEFPQPDVWALGFITGEGVAEVRERTGEDVVTVFVPIPPNPASGFFLFMPRRKVTWLKMSVEDGLKMVISGGVIGPADDECRPNEERLSVQPGEGQTNEGGNADDQSGEPV